MDQVKPFWKENNLSTTSNRHENVDAIKENEWKDSFMLTNDALISRTKKTLHFQTIKTQERMENFQNLNNTVITIYVR